MRYYMYRFNETFILGLQMGMAFYVTEGMGGRGRVYCNLIISVSNSLSNLKSDLAI